MKTRWKKKKNFKLPTSKASFLCEKKKICMDQKPHTSSPRCLAVLSWRGSVCVSNAANPAILL